MMHSFCALTNHLHYEHIDCIYTCRRDQTTNIDTGEITCDGVTYHSTEREKMAQQVVESAYLGTALYSMSHWTDNGQGIHHLTVRAHVWNYV